MKVVAVIMILLLTACTAADGDRRPAADCAKATPRDMDGDGRDDLVAGDTEQWRGGPGALYLITAGKVIKLPSPDKAARGLGAAVAMGDLDGDGCADVVAGAPYTDVAGMPGAGAVYILYGGGSKPPGKLVAPTPRPGAAFGESLAVHGDRIAVGAPHDDADGVTAAGSVHLARKGTIHRTITQDSPGIPGTSEPYDRFGTALAMGPDAVLVGTPYEGTATLVGDRATRLSPPTTCRDHTATNNRATALDHDPTRGYAATLAYHRGFVVGGCGQVRVHDDDGQPKSRLSRKTEPTPDDGQPRSGLSSTAEPTLLAASSQGYAVVWSDGAWQAPPTEARPWQQPEPWSAALTTTSLAVGMPTASPGGAVAVLDLKSGKIQTYRAPGSTQLGDALAG
ncbi:FG-GAP-like repeat-containing protein [Nonomuraea sp. NPDC050790]|uniref:FG-GAP-like repeat-containing protein n=1 Tax=Nonomuraea sp. NPDC050790 TaxID=3364371 RepID=UPI0037B37BA5